MRLVYWSWTCRLDVLKWEPNNSMKSFSSILSGGIWDRSRLELSGKFLNWCCSSYLYVKSINYKSNMQQQIVRVFDFDMNMSSNFDDTRDVIVLFECHKANLRWVMPLKRNFFQLTRIMNLRSRYCLCVMNSGSKLVLRKEMNFEYKRFKSNLHALTIVSNQDYCLIKFSVQQRYAYCVLVKD